MRLTRDGKCHPTFMNGGFAMSWPKAERPERMSLADLEGYADGLAAAGDLAEATRLRRELTVLTAIAENMQRTKSRRADEEQRR